MILDSEVLRPQNGHSSGSKPSPETETWENTIQHVTKPFPSLKGVDTCGNKEPCKQPATRYHPSIHEPSKHSSNPGQPSIHEAWPEIPPVKINRSSFRESEQTRGPRTRNPSQRMTPNLWGKRSADLTRHA